MSTLFSITFTGIFVAFGFAAILGHILLIEALVRPFFARVAVARKNTPSRSLDARPAH
jgi:hypothetical protein